MKSFIQGGVSGVVLLDTRRECKDENYPIKYRLIYHRKAVYYPSQYYVTKLEWEKIETSRTKNLMNILERVNAGFDIIENHIKEILKDGEFSFEALDSRLGKATVDNVFDAYNTKIEALYNAGQINTSDWYRYSARTLQYYLNKVAPTRSKKNLDELKELPLKFTEITVQWLKNYEKWLLDNKKSYTTISMYMRALQSIVNEGIKQNYLSQTKYPFGSGKYEIPKENGRKLALTLAQIGEVMKYELHTDNEIRYRDLWFFSYLCNGINMVDMLQLKYSDIVDGEISFYRQKTKNKTKVKKKIAVTVLPQMQTIIDKWGNPDRKPTNYLFPYFSDGLSPKEAQRTVNNMVSVINHHMKKIGEALGIGNISTYTARHSFATVLKRSGANVAFISESLGHTDLNTTENYLASFEKDERIKNASLLTNF